MDPKTRRIDQGNPAECDRLIQRGHLVLIALTTEAHAARVEAQMAELEVALSEARGGDANLLRSWLTSYHSQSPAVELNPATAPSVSAAKTHQTCTAEESGAAICKTPLTLPLDHSPNGDLLEPPLSWDRLVLGARARLEARCSRLPMSENDAAQDPLSKRLETSISKIENDLENGGEFATQHELTDEELPKEARSEQELPETLAETLAETSPEDEPLVFQDLPELQVLAEAQRDLGRPLFRSGTRGLLVSVMVHVALISTLMAITMRMPEQPASLGFEAGSSDVVVDSFDNLQPVEVTLPEDVTTERPSDVAESMLSLPSAGGLSSTSVSAASPTAVSGNLSGVQASANRAVASASGRPHPSNANASFFGAAASGNCFCYVIDGSESMRGGPWEAAKAELLRSLSTMKESHRFYIIFFNQKLNAITLPGERESATSPLYATAENLKHAQNWIESLRIERGAPPNAALQHAIELEPDAIYLLADGATKIDVPGFLRTENRTNDFLRGEQVRVPIHAIAFYSPEAGQKLMKQVAMENKGQFIYVPDPRRK